MHLVVQSCKVKLADWYRIQHSQNLQVFDSKEGEMHESIWTLYTWVFEIVPRSKVKDSIHSKM